MNERTKTRLAALALCLGFACLHIILTLTALHAVGTDADLYYAEQMKAKILPAAGIADGQLQSLDRRLADYLAGAPQALAQNPPFSEKEMTHLRDCFALFSLLRRARRRLAPWAVLLVTGGAWLLRDRRRIRLCALLSPLLTLVPLGGFALTAALNFDAAFTFFHRLLFRNDLWLLDPRTDLLIRICPESMFRHMGIRIGLCSAAAVLAVTVAAVALTRLWPKGKGENPWKTTTRRGPAPRQYDFRSRERR